MSAGSAFDPPVVTSTAPRSRALATNRRASLLRTCRGKCTSTTSTASTRAATTAGHSSPGLATSGKRSRAMPTSAAATSPRDGNPTAAHHEPACEGPASRANASDVAPGLASASLRLARCASPDTATVDPRRSPPSGSKSARAGNTGSVRSRASETGRARFFSSGKSGPGLPSATARCESATTGVYRTLVRTANALATQAAEGGPSGWRRSPSAASPGWGCSSSCPQPRGIGQRALLGTQAEGLAYLLHVGLQAAGKELAHLSEVGAERPEGVAEGGRLVLLDEEVAGPGRPVADDRRSSHQQRTEESETGGATHQRRTRGTHMDPPRSRMEMLAHVVRPELFVGFGVGRVDARY